MDLSGVASTTNASAATDRASLASNYNTFLVLLTAQLQNQDPLSPMDSTQFTQQLVQYSGVEQQIKTNDQLSNLAAQYQAASAGAALSYLGKDALMETSRTTLANGSATWAYNLPSTADSVKVSIRNASGVEVFSANGVKSTGDHAFVWDGKMTNGQTAAAGVYQMVVTAKDSSGAEITPTITTRETINGVDFSGNSPQIVTASGAHSLSEVRAIASAN